MDEIYELTNPQKSIYLTEQYYQNTTINNICGSVVIKQNVNLKLLNTAINYFIKNNDSFKLRFRQVDSEVFQYFAEDENYNFEKIDIQEESQIEFFAKKEVNTKFDLFASRLFDFKLFKLDSGFGGFIINAHHIISDAATLSMLAVEIVQNYSKLLKNEKIESKPYSYLDYIDSENKYIESSRFEKDRAYWDKVLTPLPEVATFVPQNLENADSPSSKREEFTLDLALVNKIKKYCTQNHISMYNFLIGIFAIYLGKTNNMEVFTIGTPVLNRTTPVEKQTSGMFINTSLLKIDISKNITFKEFLQNIATESIGMLKHQKYNYQYILNDVRKKDKSIPNLYDVILSYQITKATNLNIDIPYSAKWYGTDFIANSLNVHFHDIDNTGSLIVEYDYKSSKISSSEIKKMHSRIIDMFKQVLINEDISIFDIDIVTVKEKKEILNDFNMAPFSYPQNKDLIQLFKETVQKKPDNIAISFENRKVTYRELDKLSDNLACILKKYNISYEEPVGIFLDKSIEMIISILAILKVNGAFLPIDIEYPEDRINYILKDANARITLTTFDLANRISGLCETLLLDKLNLNKTLNFTYKPISPASLAYVMYTSGSTGKPKGTMIEQFSVLRLAIKPNFIKFSTQERILQTGSIVFDACTFEIWAALLNGFELYILKKEHLLNPMFLVDYLIENKITTLFITTSLFNQLSDINPEMFQNVRYLLTGGDVISTKHINQVMDACPKLKIVHCYGPTENTTFSTCFNIDKKYDTTVPIGSPISGTTCYIVSKSGSLEPVGVPGELLVGGDGVSRGYLNKDTLTAKSFVPNPFDKTSNIYRTGDLVKWGPDGNIVFIGRIDGQVKIRGFRVELSEINTNILSYPDVKNSYTIIQTIGGSKEICSYIVPNENLDLEDLKTFLKQSMPSYMVPDYFTIMEDLPLTINGKVDKSKLPTPSLIKKNRELIKPKTAFELEIFNIVKDLVETEDFSVADDFFDDLGLDSLNAMSLCSSLYNYNISIQDVSDYPSVQDLASKIEKHLTSSHFENVLPQIEIKNEDFEYDLSHVLLTGAPGFLGMHLLRELLLCDKVKKVYCLIRNKGNSDFETRFNKSLNYYFKDSLDKFVSKKLELICGDFEFEDLGLLDEEYKRLARKITTVVHCGANVKHYGNFQKFKSANVVGTQNIIEFCKNSNAKLAHISTISVSGYERLNENLILTENDFNIGQCFNNHVYMITKYLAEYNVLSAMNNGLIKAKIFRMGNIMPRYEDNVFQQNAKDNALFSRLQTILSLGIITKSYEKMKIDYSPVDLCAKAVINIMEKPEKQTIYHIYNDSQITIKDFLKAVKIKVDYVPIDEFIAKVQNSNNPLATHLLNDIQNPEIALTPIANDLTISILQKNGFSWNKIDDAYINNLIKLI